MADNQTVDLLNQQISDTGLTHGWILNILKNYDNSFKQTVNGNVVTKITARDISENKGYCSKIYKTNVYVDNQETPVYNFIMKIPTDECINKTFSESFSEEEQDEMGFMKDNKMMEKLALFHNVECDFYDNFKDFQGLPLPKVFYTQKCLLKEKQLGVIFMEDLSEKMQSLGIFNSLNVFQIKNIVQHLACFHAHLMETENKWAGKFTGLHMFDDEFMDGIKKMNTKVIEDHPEYAVPMQKLDRYLYDIDLVKYSLVGCCKDIGVPSLLQLGDLWTNNVMFEHKEGNIPNKVLAFVDFQLAFEGNPALDMARIITLCTDAEIRRELEKFICDFYYEKLTKFIRRKPGFTVSQFKTAYNYAMINQATWTPMIGMVMSSNNDVSEDIKQARQAKLVLRSKFALEDAVKKLEVLQPSWIPSVEVNGA